MSKPLLEGVQAMGYGEPTRVQLRAIPPALAGRDVIASAQTGAGKTAAFALPALQKLGSHGKLRCLVLEPTRELAMQVETSMRDLARFTDLKVGSIFGGVGYGADRIAKRLRANNHSVAVLHANRSQNQRIEALEGTTR
ncbi:MAG: DEAD/DEAH box helicase [Chthoniobacterales bacterium]